MSVPYRQLLRMAGMRVGAIPGATQTQRDAHYLASPMIMADLGTRDFPFSNIKDLCIGTVGEVIQAYASVLNHPFRTSNTSQTVGLGNKELIPATDSAGKRIVGVYGAIRDTSDDETLTKQPLQLIRTLVENTNGFLRGEYYYFDIVDRVIYHTRDEVKIDVCTFSASVEMASLEADGNAPIPDAAMLAVADGMAARMIVDDEFAAQSQVFSNYYQAGLALFRLGGVAYQPAPIGQTSIDPRAS